MQRSLEEGLSVSTDRPPEHIYRRGAIDLESQDSLSKVASQIPQGSTVLDLGCAVGALGQYLSQHKGCIVDGVEANSEAAALARPYYRDVFEIDLEESKLTDELMERNYDVIVCADVLEHLRDPGALLKTLADHLGPKGNFLISIPNAGYIGVITELLDGEFRYRDEGILDATHLRFFTRQSLLRMLEESGLVGEIIDTTTLDLPQSEFGDERHQHINEHLQTMVAFQPDYVTYQFIAIAHPRTKGRGAAGNSSKKTAAPQVGPQTRTKVRWRLVDDPFTEENSAWATSPRWAGPQSLRFELPRSAMDYILRLDPTDQVGVVALHQLRVIQKGDEVWRWEPGDQSPFHQGSLHQLVELHSSPDAIYLFATGPDNFGEIDYTVLATPRETTVEVSLSTLALRDATAAISAYLADINQRSEARIANLRGHLEADRSTREFILKGRILFLEDEKQQLRDELIVRERQLKEINHDLQLRIDDLLNSTSWKLTAPVRMSKERLAPRVKSLLGSRAPQPAPDHKRTNPSSHK